jgi:ubiquinone/menaquinone biosynthesis C-methylase UbiE
LRISDDSRRYHATELMIARTRDHPNRIMPEAGPADRRILDLGCGAGQTLIALELHPSVFAVGVDRDLASLELGREWAPGVLFVGADGEALPFSSQSFDLVISRVALPYMNIPVALAEIFRVLTPGGRVWLTLHPARLILGMLGRSLTSMNYRASIFFTYALLNGLLFHVTGRLARWPFARRRYESVQTRRSIMRALRNAGFQALTIDVARHFVATAQRPDG